MTISNIKPIKQHLFKFLLIILCLSGCKKDNQETSTYQHIDYKNTANWFKLGNNTNYDIDVFYLYPTSWTPKESDGLYCSIDNQSLHEKVPFVYQQQASLFEDFTNVYVPWYRQADALALLSLPLEDQDKKIMECPYIDALDAFEYYLNNYNKGKPFILAGHSQGANVLKFILQYYMKDHPDVLNRMVVAYPLGYSFEQSYFDQNQHLNYSENETDTQVIVTWNCERLNNGQFGSYNYVCHQGALSTNPISWQHDNNKIPADDPRNLGCRFLDQAKYSTQVLYDDKRGYEVLIIGIDNASLDSFIGEYSLHGYDFTLFYDNIKQNAKKRISSFKNKN